MKLVALSLRQAELSNTDLDSDVVEYLATNFKTQTFANWREHFESTACLCGNAEFHAAAEEFWEILNNRPQHITAKQIIDKTARYYNIDVKDMCSSDGIGYRDAKANCDVPSA